MFTIILLLASMFLVNIYTVQKNNVTKKHMPIIVIAFLLVVILLIIPVLLLLVCVFGLYRTGINVILKAKYGSSYRGLVKKFDSIHAIDDVSNSKTSVLVIIEWNRTQSTNGFFKMFSEVLAQYHMDSFVHVPKLQSRYYKYMGYTYMIKEEVTPSDFVKKMPLIESRNKKLDKAEFAQLLNQVYNLDFPQNNTLYWDIQVGSQAIDWKHNSNQNIEYYPILLRNHHCVADGVSLLKLFMGVLPQQEGIQFENSRLYTKSSIYEDFFDEYVKLSFEQFALSLSKIVTNIFASFCVFILAPSSMFLNLFLKANDDSILCGKKLSGQSTLAFFFENGDTYFQKVKRIKQKISETSFSTVLLTAFSASLCNYFERKSIIGPEFTTSIIPLVSGSSELQNLRPGSFSIRNINFNNNYSVVLLNVPLFIKNKNASLRDRLKVLKEQVQILNNSIDYKINYVFINFILSVFPSFLIRMFLKTLKCTTSISIMPGTTTAKYGNHYAVDVGFWVPHLKNIGVTFSVFTYEKRLFVGLSVDKALIGNDEEVQNIVDDIVMNIDLIEEEVMCQ